MTPETPESPRLVTFERNNRRWTLLVRDDGIKNPGFADVFPGPVPVPATHADLLAAGFVPQQQLATADGLSAALQAAEPAVRAKALESICNGASGLCSAHQQPCWQCFSSLVARATAAETLASQQRERAESAEKSCEHANDLLSLANRDLAAKRAKRERLERAESALVKIDTWAHALSPESERTAPEIVAAIARAIHGAGWEATPAAPAPPEGGRVLCKRCLHPAADHTDGCPETESHWMAKLREGQGPLPAAPAEPAQPDSKVAQAGEGVGLESADLRNDLLDIAECKPTRFRTPEGKLAKERVAKLEAERAALMELEQYVRSVYMGLPLVAERACRGMFIRLDALRSQPSPTREAKDSSPSPGAPEEHREVSKASTGDAAGDKCPSCHSPNPKLHPAVQHEGEVRICSDAWHNGPAPAAEVEQAAEWVPLSGPDYLAVKEGETYLFAVNVSTNGESPEWEYFSDAIIWDEDTEPEWSHGSHGWDMYDGNVWVAPLPSPPKPGAR